MINRLVFSLLVFATPVVADPPGIVGSELSGSRISVTLAHPDTGWDHYADGWRIESADGTVVATRELLHPHETEQPFTRSLSFADLPQGALFIRAKCSVDGWSEQRVLLER